MHLIKKYNIFILLLPLLLSCNAQHRYFFPEFKNLATNYGDSILTISKKPIQKETEYYPFKYNFCEVHLEGLMHATNNRIIISSPDRKDSSTLFDFNMKSRDSIHNGETAATLAFSIKLDLKYFDSHVEDTIYKFRMYYPRAVVSPDIVFLVSKTKGVLANYACFPWICNGVKVDDIIAFVGDGSFTHFNPNASHYR